MRVLHLGSALDAMGGLEAEAPWISVGHPMGPGMEESGVWRHSPRFFVDISAKNSYSIYFRFIVDVWGGRSHMY